jgi:hypothetical protein
MVLSYEHKLGHWWTLPVSFCSTFYPLFAAEVKDILQVALLLETQKPFGPKQTYR